MKLTFKVQSADGVIWKQAQYDVFLRLPFGASTSNPTSYRGFLDNDGAGTVTLTDTNDADFPTGASWHIKVVPHLSDDIPSPEAFTFTEPIGAGVTSIEVTPPAFPFVAK